MRQLVGQRRVKGHARPDRERLSLVVLVVFDYLGANLVQRRNLTRELLGQGDDIHAIQTDNRPGKWIFWCQGKGFLGEVTPHLKIARSVFTVKRLGDLDGQSFLFGQRPQVFRPQGFHVEQRGGKVRSLLPGALRLEAFPLVVAELYLGLFQRLHLRLAQEIGPFSPIRFLDLHIQVGHHGQLLVGLRLEVRQIKPDIADLHPVMKAIHRQPIGIKLGDRFGRCGDTGQIVGPGEEHGFGGHLLVLAPINVPQLLRRDQPSVQAHRRDQLLHAHVMAHEALEIIQLQAGAWEDLPQKYLARRDHPGPL